MPRSCSKYASCGLLVVAAAGALALAGCKAKPNLNDTTPPTITLSTVDKANNNTVTFHQPNTAANAITIQPNFDFLIEVRAHDDGGLKNLQTTVSFPSVLCGAAAGDGKTLSDTFNNITVDSVSLPAKPNPDGTVATDLPYLLEVTPKKVTDIPCGTRWDNNKPFTLTTNGGGTLKVEVKADNAAGLSTTSDWFIKLP